MQTTRARTGQHASVTVGLWAPREEEVESGMVTTLCLENRKATGIHQFLRCRQAFLVSPETPFTFRVRSHFLPEWPHFLESF